jgi:hypothetical protein
MSYLARRDNQMHLKGPYFFFNGKYINNQVSAQDEDEQIPIKEEKDERPSKVHTNSGRIIFIKICKPKLLLFYISHQPSSFHHLLHKELFQAEETIKRKIEICEIILQFISTKHNEFQPTAYVISFGIGIQLKINYG